MKLEKGSMYKNLAWTEPIIATPQDYEEDTELFSNLIKKYSRIDVRTLLHFGCGAGGNDFTFKKHFKVTGIDLSKEMLAIIIGFAVIVLVGAIFGSYQWGKGVGYDEGYKEGYSLGEKTGYDDGYKEGKDDGYDDGYKVGEKDGYE